MNVVIVLQVYSKNVQAPAPDTNLLPEELLKEIKPVPNISKEEKSDSELSITKAEKVVNTVRKIKSTSATLDSNIFDDIKHVISKIEQTLPPVPSTSYQFYTDWKVIAKSPELKYKYLKVSISSFFSI